MSVKAILMPVATLFSILISAYAIGVYLVLGLEGFEPMMPHFDTRRVVLTLHVISAPVALLIGGFQFYSRLRNRYLTLHRWAGRIYAMAILVAALSAFNVGYHAVGGPVASLGFMGLSLAWLYTTAMAVWAARSGQIAQHRVWMIQSFALTFAAVTFRVHLGVMLGGMGMDYPEASMIAAWTCWVPNILVAQWWLLPKHTATLPV